MSEKRMTFFQHLGELRSRLTVVFAAIVIVSAIAYPFSLNILKALLAQLPPITLTTRNFMEAFMLRFRISILTAFAACTPLIFYEILAFLSPALKGKEKRVLYPLTAAMAVLFLGGAAFSYFLVMPVGVKWLLEQGGELLIPLNNATDSLNFVILFLVAFGVAFETPLVIYVLLRLGIVSYHTLRRNWRFAYVTIVLMAAVATPDWSIPPMLMLAAAMLVLYELTLLLAWRRFGRAKAKALEP